MKLIVGLGNPGEKYFGSRHNLGFMVLDDYRRKLAALDWKLENKFKAEISKIDDLILARPQTYMNQSGLAVLSLKNFYKIDSKDIIIVHDELDLLLGHIKVRLGGGAGGHHGVEDIIKELGTDQFVRVRLGIGSDKSFSGEHKRISFNAEAYVLEQFLAQESSSLKRMIKKAISSLETILDKGVEIAQNQFN